MVKKRSIGVALAAVFVLLALTIRTDVAHGAIGIDTERKDCSIKFNLAVDAQKPQPGEEQKPGTDGEQKPGEGKDPTTGDDGAQELTGFEELEKLPIEVELYQVADVNVSGKYMEPKEGDKSLYQVVKGELGKVNAETKAAQWMEMAKIAMEQVEEKSLSSIAKTTLNSGQGNEIKNLSTGLYLVVAKEVQSSEYIYRFTPYLVSLPGNDYQQEGDSDEWKYEVEVSLKPSQENRYGDLEITKTLKSYNATLGGATFIFQVDAEKDGIVFSDVVSLVFDQPGTKTVKLAERIPAGAVVTVKEVYSGASYEVTSDPEQTTTIVASDPDNPGSVASVAFTNDYDDRLNGGTSVVNHFLYTEPAGSETGTGADSGSGAQTPEGVWDYEQLKDSTQETGRAVEHEENAE